MKLDEILNIYDLHDDPKSLKHHDEAHNNVPSLAWEQCVKSAGGTVDENGDVTSVESMLKLIQELGKHEKLWATDPEYAFRYAGLIRKRFKLGEKAIIDSDIRDGWITAYAYNIVKGRWREAEKKLATNAWAALDYANIVLKGRFKLGEKTIVKTPYAYAYANSVIKGRWPEAEKYADKNGLATTFRSSYVKNCLKLTGAALIKAVEKGPPFP